MNYSFEYVQELLSGRGYKIESDNLDYREDGKHYSLIVSKVGKTYFFKMLDKNDVRVRSNFLGEVQMLQIAGEDDSLRNYSSRLIEYNVENNPLWYIRYYYPGIQVGDFVTDWGYSVEVLRRIEPRSFIDLSRAIWGVERRLSVQEDIRLRRETFLPEYVMWSIRDNVHLLGEKLSKVAIEFIDTYKIWYTQSWWVVNHNDLWPGNLLYTDTDLQIIDWEWAGFSYPLFDQALMAVCSWVDPDWSRLFIHEVIDAFNEFSVGKIKTKNTDCNWIYLKIGYLYWAITLMMKIQRYEEYLKSNGMNLDQNQWYKLVSSIRSMTEYLLE